MIWPGGRDYSPAMTQQRALVLGGGGVTGIAWMTGLLHAFARDGADLTVADRVIGTSAGSVVGAQITGGATLSQLYDEQTTPASTEIGAEFPLTTALRFVGMMVAPGGARTRRARLGRAARAAHPGPADKRLQVIRSRLGDLAWPDRDLRITAVDADSGEFQVWTSHSGVSLVEAVASSCAVPMVWPAVEIEGRHYIDGGVRSNTNADLARGCDTVVVIAPIARSLNPSMSIGKQLARTGARRTAVVAPDEAALAAIGRNVLDPQKRVGAALAGYAQGQRIAQEMAAGWNA